MKKMTFLLLHLNYGGLERQTITLINQLAKTKKYDILVISVYDLLNGKSFYPIDESVKIKFLAKFGPDHKKINEAKQKKNLPKLIKYSFLGIRCLWYKKNKLKSVIKNLDTDIIFSTRIEFSRYIKRRDTINISQEHSYITTPKYIDSVRKSFNNINYIVVMTEKAKEVYEGWLKNYNTYSKVIKIENMIDDSKYLISNLSNNQIISIGRLEQEKDYNTLIEVFKIVHNQMSDVTLKIVGDGSQREYLEQKAKLLGLDNNIIFTGSLSANEIQNELLNSSVCISTSIVESFSLILVEAMSYGVPGISFNIDVGPKEIIDDGINGFLIPNRNIQKMAESIMLLLKNDNMLKVMSQNAKNNARMYFASNVIKRWEEILEKGDKVYEEK